MLLLHLQPTSCLLDGLLTRVPTHHALDLTGSLQVGKFYLLSIRGKIDGIFEGRDYESAAEIWPIGSDGGEIEDVVSLG